MIKAIIFDLDGVLVSTDELHYRAWKALAGRLADAGAPELYAGHCTGEAAMEALRERFPGRVHRLTSGAAFAL